MNSKFYKNKRKTLTKVHQPKHTTIFRKQNFYILFLIIITLILFSNALNNGFTNWDDTDYVTENTFIKDLSINGIQNIFTAIVSFHYHPLTLLSLAVDYHFWGMNPKGFILGNIIFHILNTVLVFLIFIRFTKKTEMALIIALLFAIHPMRVESVVWISERKDVLYAFFYLLALFTYLKYITTNYLKKYYWLTLLFALLSLLAKAMAVSLPIVLLLFDYYYNRKNYKTLIIEKIPFFLISLLIGIIAIFAQSAAPQNAYPIIDKIFLITYATTFYFVKFFIPIHQSPLVEFPVKIGELLPFKFYISFLIIPLFGFLIYKLKSIRKEIIFSLLFFISTMLIILIKFPIGPAYLAERYTYIPYIGMAFIIAVLYIKLSKKYSKNIVTGVVVIWFIFLGIKTHFQNTIWRSSETLWSNIIENNPHSEIAYNNRGLAEDKLGNVAGAINDFNNVININPQNAMAYYNRGISKKELGDYEGAITDYTRTINIDPKYEGVYYYRGNAKGLTGDFKGAIADYNKAIENDPKSEKAITGRGTAKIQLGDLTGAIEDFNYALKVNPNYTNAYNCRGIAHSIMKNFDLALRDINSAIAIDKDYADAYLTKGNIYIDMNNTSEACIQFETARQKGDDDAINMINLYCNQK